MELKKMVPNKTVQKNPVQKKMVPNNTVQKNNGPDKTYADVATIQLQAEDIRNKHVKIISLVLSGIFLIGGITTFLIFRPRWGIAFALLGISASFFGISRLEVFATKTNEQAIRKIQKIKKNSAEEIL